MVQRKKQRGRRLERSCAACGELVPVFPNEFKYQRAFTCEAHTADRSEGLPDGCLLRDPDVPDDTRAAVRAMIAATIKADDEAKRASSSQRVEILRRYINDVRTGEPPLEWYRAMLRQHTTRNMHLTMAWLPFMHRRPLRFESLNGIRAIDRCLEDLRADTNAFFADLLSAYVDDQYALLHFGFDNGLYDASAAIKVDTLRRDVISLKRYLKWLHSEGHETLQHAGRAVMDVYMAETGAPVVRAYQISRFHRWAKKKHPFTPTIGYHRRRQPPPPQAFKVLTLDESRATFDRICAHGDPRGRAWALLALLYAQQVSESLTLKRSDLVRDDTTGLWTIAREGTDPFAVEKEVSEALDECLATHPVAADGAGPQRLVFANRLGRPYAQITATRMIRAASGVTADKLRRTAIINMYRSGQKTMATVVLREVLGVDPNTIRRAIRLTGQSVNAPTIEEDAEALRRSFLEFDEEDEED